VFNSLPPQIRELSHNRHYFKHILKEFLFTHSFYTLDEYFNFNPLTPNDHYSGRTAPLTSKRCILYIYSTNTGTKYFKRGIYYPFFSLQHAVCFIILTYLVPVSFTFYIQGVLKFKKNNSGAKRLIATRLTVLSIVTILCPSHLKALEWLNYNLICTALYCVY